MVYNLGKTFKDVLKIISLGVMASINGVSSDVFAMDEKYQEGCRGGFKRYDVTKFQNEEDPDVALELALALSGSGDFITNTERSDLPPPYTVRAAAAPVDEGTDAMERALEASRASQQEEEDFQRILRLSLEESRGLAPNLNAYGSQDVVAATQASSLKAHEEGVSEQDPSGFSVKTWKESEVKTDDFEQHILQQADLILTSLLKGRADHDEFENLSKREQELRDEAARFMIDEDERQKIESQLAEILEKKNRIQMIVSAWVRDEVVPKMLLELSLKNKGTGVEEKIREIIVSRIA